MAKGINVKGLTIEDILNLDSEAFNKLGVSDLRQVVGRLVSAGNKRLRSFASAGEDSPAVAYIARSGGAFSTKGKSLNQLRAEYVRAKNFFRAETGTRGGWRTVKRKSIAALKKATGIELTEEQFGKFWKSYEKLKQLDKSVAEKSFKYVVLQHIRDLVDDSQLSPEDIATRLSAQLGEIYEQRAALDNDVDGVSGFFIP